MQPLVSINIPVFKCEDYIIRCLDSVKNQTYQNLEIILVNDCTPDNSIQLIEEYFKNNPALNSQIYHNEKNQGLSVVRNKAIEKSSGKYIYMLDSDDYITPNCIEELVEISEETHSDITVGETICWDSNEGKEKNLFPIRASEDSIEGNDLIFERFIEGDWPIIGPNKLYNREWILTNNLKFIPGLFSQDELWAFHCAFKLNKISFYKHKTYIYYLHGASTIFNKKKINFENHQTIVEYFTKGFLESDSTKKQLIKKKLISFKSTTLMMQWRSMRADIAYWKQNYNRLKKAPSLSLSDYFSSDFTLNEKKQNFYLNLPTEIGFRLFKKRYGN